MVAKKSKNRLTKVDVAATVAEKAGVSKAQATRTLSAMLDIITENLAAEKKISLTGFGTFDVVHAKARNGVNPRTGASIKIPARIRPVFRAGAGLKRAVKS